MAKILEFSRDEFGRDSQVNVTRGDDWKLKASIFEERGGCRDLVKLADADIVGVTGYFKADECNEDVKASGLSVLSSVVVLEACQGEFCMELPKEETILVSKSEGGSDIYVVTEYSDGRIETVYTRTSPLSVQDRGFTTF